MRNILKWLQSCYRFFLFRIKTIIFMILILSFMCSFRCSSKGNAELVIFACIIFTIIALLLAILKYWLASRSVRNDLLYELQKIYVENQCNLSKAYREIGEALLSKHNIDIKITKAIIIERPTDLEAGLQNFLLPLLFGALWSYLSFAGKELLGRGEDTKGIVLVTFIMISCFAVMLLKGIHDLYFIRANKFILQVILDR